MLQGFKKFVMRGNVIDLAVAVVIADAFRPIVENLVTSVINPLIGAIFGKPNFDDVGKFKIGDATIAPGTVITAIVSFLLIAVAVYFALVVPMNKLNERAAARRGAAATEEKPSEEVQLLREIRDSLARR